MRDFKLLKDANFRGSIPFVVLFPNKPQSLICIGTGISWQLHYRKGVIWRVCVKVCDVEFLTDTNP